MPKVIPIVPSNESLSLAFMPSAEMAWAGNNETGKLAPKLIPASALNVKSECRAFSGKNASASELSSLEGKEKGNI
jgi:hypothetical protein